MRPCPRTHYQLCLSLLPSTLHSHQIPQIELDSLLLPPEQSRPDTRWGIGLRRPGECQLYTPGELKADPDFAPTHARTQILIQKLHDYRLETRSFNLLGSTYFESETFHLAQALQQAANNLFCPRQ